ncbi:hypothetical protein M501DRAFT_928027 [Patellaria atrata CBS 101060]|uniref:Trafficking protein particle complex II-specific subunit 65 IgD3 domain-containing protein n=1 Tax=Patellaria atrata CBS 101060 TaxID=1346257 RepID=A0A9P4VSU8_9PEZI|nr:hypothetical protein M501DRAFT_928027 [Patellaria atrata CBS 101060]
MASPTNVATEGTSRGSLEFTENAILEALVPFDTSFDVTSALERFEESSQDSNSSILPSLEQRQILFFDEIVPVYAVLKAPYAEENQFKSYLSRLSITLETYVIGTPPSPQQDPKDSQQPPVTASKEQLHSQIIKDENEPFIVVQGEPSSGSSEDEQFIYVFWRVDVLISRPRTQLVKPCVYFSVSASLKAPQQIKQEILDDEYLPSFVPLASNLLGSLVDDPGLEDVDSHLSSSITRTGSLGGHLPQEFMRPIKTGHRKIYRTSPLIIWRLRYSKAASSLHESQIFASLDLEITPFAGCDVTIQDVQVSIPNGQITLCSPTTGLQLPLNCRPQDQVTFLYNISPNEAEEPPNGYSITQFLDVTVDATAFLALTCRPDIKIKWRAPIDLRAGLRLKNMPDGLNRSRTEVPHPTAKVTNPDALPAPNDRIITKEVGSGSDIDLMVTVSGPEVVYLPEPFHWRILVLNRSQRVQNFSIVVIPMRRRRLSLRGEGFVEVDGQSYSMGSDGLSSEASELLPLTMNAVIGPLDPGGCQTAEIEFLPLMTGLLRVEALRLVDIVSQEVAHIYDLPDIVAHWRENAPGSINLESDKDSS